MHQRPLFLRSQLLSAATKRLVLWSCIAPCMAYSMELWRPAKKGANITAALMRAATLISRIHTADSHMTFFKNRSVNQDVILVDRDILSPDDH